MPGIHRCNSSQACHQLQQFAVHVGPLLCLVYLLLAFMPSSLADGADVSPWAARYNT